MPKGRIDSVSSRVLGCLVAALWLGTVAGQASVLDWDSVGTWTDGSVAAQTVTVDGVDITFTWSGNTAQFTGTAPSVGNTITGGVGGAPDSLQMFVDFANTAQAITLTVSFSTMVTDVNFDIFNIDAQRTRFFLLPFNTYQDAVTVTGNSGTSDPTSITTSANNSQVGADGVTGDLGFTQTATALTSGAANAGFDFGGTEIDNFSIVFSSAAADIFGGVQPQAIALHDISFTIVPEAETYWAMAGLLGVCFIAGAARRWRVLCSASA